MRETGQFDANLQGMGSGILTEIRAELSELYNNDSIFDKFDCCLSSDGRQFATGSYSNTFRIFSRDDGHEVGIVLNVSKNAPRSSHSTNPRTARRLPGFAWGKRGNENSGCEISSIIPCDFTTKVIPMAWHPTADMIACASANTLYIYCS